MKAGLGILIKTWRDTEGLSLRECSKLIGISYLTLRRLERGMSISQANLAKVLVWALGGGSNA